MPFLSTVMTVFTSYTWIPPSPDLVCTYRLVCRLGCFWFQFHAFLRNPLFSLSVLCLHSIYIRWCFVMTLCFLGQSLPLFSMSWSLFSSMARLCISFFTVTSSPDSLICGSQCQALEALVQVLCSNPSASLPCYSNSQELLTIHLRKKFSALIPHPWSTASLETSSLQLQSQEKSSFAQATKKLSSKKALCGGQ